MMIIRSKEASAAGQSGSQAPQKGACDASVERTSLDGGASGNRQSGQILLSALTISLVVLLLSIGVVTFASVSYRLVKQSQFNSQALSVSEAGVDHAIRQLNLNSTYAGETDTAFGNGVFTTTVTGSGSTRTIEAVGCIPDCTNPRSERTVRVQARISTTDVEFFYGIQVDEGGLHMNNNAQVQGNIYSNGDITGGNGAFITGDATVAGGAAATVDQSQEVTNGTQEVGRTSGQADVAQSFIPSVTEELTKVGVYLSKVGSPGNLPLRIVEDDSDEPSNDELANVTISSASVGLTASWIEVSFSSPPSLSAGTRYWIILDGTANNSNYYLWSKDTANSYANGRPMADDNWNTGNPNWSSLTGDLAFRTYMGGVATKIDNVDVNGTARANTIKDLAVGVDAYYQTIINSTVGGTSFPNSPDQPRQDLPISDGVIQDWKNDAAAGGTYTGDYILTNGASASLGPKRVTGKLILDNLATLTMTGTLWVEGDVTLSNNCTIRLDPAYGNNSGIIVTDGKVVVSNNCVFQGSGNPPSYIMMLTAKNSPLEEIMTIDNNSVGVIYYAGKGRIKFSNNANAKEATAWGITLDNNATITYESGLANVNFTSGPGGGWSVVAGTWQEIK